MFLSFSFFLTLDSYLPTYCRCRGCCCTWSHSDTHTHSVGLLWTRDRPVAETFTWQHTQDTDNHGLAGFETTIPASERLDTYGLDRAATGITKCSVYIKLTGCFLIFHVGSERRIIGFSQLNRDNYNNTFTDHYNLLCITSSYTRCYPKIRGISAPEPVAVCPSTVRYD
jgi:hypothetical protein